jgi:CubicO group peptidase (beta-lactamase class C family)
MMRPGSLTRRAFGNPRELLVDANLNRPDVLAVEIPAANGIGEARAVAAAYSAAVTGELGLSDHTLDALVRPAAPPSDGPDDLVLRTPTAFSLGNVKPMPALPFGSSANAAFGTPGNGGSFGFADPDTRIGYCYAPNRLGFGLVGEREIALRDALYRDVLGERPQRP